MEEVIDTIVTFVPLGSILVALITFAYNHHKDYEIKKITHFMRLRSRMYTDGRISFVINSANMGKITGKMFDDVNLFSKISATLGFLDEICHLFNIKYLGKDEFAYFEGEIYAVLNDPEITNFLNVQEQKNAAHYIFSGDAIKNVDKILPYTTLQITNYSFTNGCSKKEAYRYYDVELRKKYNGA